MLKHLMHIKIIFIMYLVFFVPFCVKIYKPQSRIVRDNRTNKIYSSISFTTMQLSCFNEFKKIFYDINVKIIPNNIE